MSSITPNGTPLSQSDSGTRSSRGARALAAAQQIANQTQQEQKQRATNSINVLHRIESKDLVWMAYFDNVFHFSHEVDKDAVKGIDLISWLDRSNSDSSSWTASSGCDQFAITQFEVIKNAIDQTVNEFKSSSLPFVFAARFQLHNETCFQFSQFERDEAFTHLTDGIAYMIMDLGEWLELYSTRRYF